MIRCALLAVAALCAAGAATGQSQTGGLIPIEETLGRPAILYVDGLIDARPGVQAYIADLYAESGAFGPPVAVRELADVDVYVLILAEKSVEDLPPDFPLRATMAAQLAAAAPESGITAYETGLHRAPGLPAQSMRVILVDQSHMGAVSDLCLAVALHDVGRWYFSDPGQSRLGPAYTRVARCVAEDWQEISQAF